MPKRKPTNRRKRRVHVKDRTGCENCRQRRIKCNEDIPCSRCHVAGLACLGPRPLPRSNLTDLTQDELRGLQHFRERTAHSLGNAYDHDFWTHAVMRLSYRYEAIQHFIIALSSLDESFRLRAVSSTPPWDSQLKLVFGLQQYDKGIKGILNTNGVQPVPIVAIVASAVLCFVLEVWLGNMYAGQNNAFAALQLLSNQQFEFDDEAQDFLTRYFRPVILSFCSQFSSRSYHDGEIDNKIIAPRSTSPLNTPELNLPFKDQHDANVQFEKVSTYVLAQAKVYSVAQRNTVDHLRAEIEELCSYIDQWHIKLGELDLQIRPKGTAWDLERCHLEIKYRYLRINIMVLPFHNEMLFDQFIDDFRVIVETCELILQSAAKINPGVHRSNEPITTMALSFTGCNCRDASIRRMAVRLLYRHRRLDIIWSSTATGIYVEHVLMLEEEGLSGVELCSDIPSSRRVQLLGLNYVSGHLDHLQRRSHISQEIQYRTIALEKFSVMSDCGLESIIWFPSDSNAQLLREEIASVESSCDGPHMIDISWTVVFNHDLDSVSKLQWSEVRFTD
ncbi:hypothetical protein N431DRAFT_441006 [Stipitochalara longipes BDJ]|nr:hypothetical protein N431DRAFT_441006 [Stipitochalara longipes BDJ]